MSKKPKSAKPRKADLPTSQVQEFRSLLAEALEKEDAVGRKWANARWGVYAFFDYDGEPIYVGQTNEQLRVRIGRHLTNQRTDAVAMRVLDIFEVAEMRLWPLWDLEATPSRKKDAGQFDMAKAMLDAAEYTAYLDAIRRSRFKAILNEKIPPVSKAILLPPCETFVLVSEATRRNLGHPDTRIARRADTISRLAAVVHERGEVSDGLRRVLVIQAVRLAYLTASRLAHAEGKPAPEASSIDMDRLIGSVLAEYDDQDEAEANAS